MKKGIVLGNRQFDAGSLYYKSNNGLTVFDNGKGLWYYDGKKFDSLPSPFRRMNNYTKITYQRIWQKERNVFYSFDPRSESVDKYSFWLPSVNSYATEHHIDENYIWIERPGQISLIDLSNKKQFIYNDESTENHKEVIFNDCNVFILYDTKVIQMPKEVFINKCFFFDAENHEYQFNQFHNIVDSIGIKKDTLQDVVLEKLQYLKSLYSGTDHIEIIQQLERLNSGAFIRVHYAFPEGHIACYKNESLPLEQRVSCINSLLDEYILHELYNEIPPLEQEFVEYFGQPVRNRDYYFISTIDSVNHYLWEVDSLNNCPLSSDSLFFYKAMAIQSICNTPLFCSEGCGGCDYSLLFSRLKEFSSKYPNSKFTDNSEWFRLNYLYTMDIGSNDDELTFILNEYNSFLKKHPDTDLKEDVLFSTFWVLSSFQNPDVNKIKQSARIFLNESSNIKRKEQVNRRIEKLHLD